MGYKMNISSLRKAFIFMGAVAALSLVNAQSALAANESAKDMTCQEFIDLVYQSIRIDSMYHSSLCNRLALRKPAEKFVYLQKSSI